MTEDRFGIVGKVIARTYEVRDVVAEGGFGVVYRAYHRGFRAEVALKCLKIPNELSNEQRAAFLEQFRSEAEVLFRLSAHNTNIVRPLHVDAFHTAEQKLVPFMALEWLNGRTLDALIIQRNEKGRPPLSLEKLVRLLTPVAEALEQAHHLPGASGVQAVVHRDMKPENLFIARIGDRDVAKVLDFGISKVKSTAGQMAGKASVKADTLVSFSPAYGAPEQWAPRKYGQTGTWTDVWGLALTIVEAAKGSEVVLGDHTAMMGTILDPTRRPTPQNEGIATTPSVNAVFERALAVDPRQRYQSVGQFWDELSSALGLTDSVPAISVRSSPQRSSGRATTGFDSVVPGPSAAALEAIPNLSDARGPISAQGIAPARRPLASVRDDETMVDQRPSTKLPLDNGYHGISPLPATPRPARPPLASSWAPSRPSVWKALSPALALLALSVAVTVLDRAFAHSRGVPLNLGPVRASWIAAGLMIIALISGIKVIKRALED